MPEDAQRQIGMFLRRKRENLAPEIAGFSRTARARTPGLRREDVAAMAGISTVWYSKIERGKADGISREALLSLARALRLDETERQYLMTLARMEMIPVRDPCMHVNRDTLRLLGRLDPLPAILINDYFDILAANRAYEAMCGLRFEALPEADRNYVGLILTNPVWRRFLEVEDEAVQESRLARIVGMLRGVNAARPGDRVLTARIERFRTMSPAFARCWDSEAVARPEELHFSFTHAVLGRIVLRKQIWQNFNGETSGRLNVYHPLDEDGFARLASVTGVPTTT
ncbi:helix-turn-helix domain-containing protein [Magnetospirillum fulvum]|uniref:Helix-turn-helix domain-containing protein n=1 Tax=Magnetospirillum fulvum TaxID=1082 RepID=A0A1H6J621_MAGFU|nr:helix-turn-helix transcriptional regulator [Magnetospirillum fulvum]SEH56169.1 Helix-turn-helix domain-containing protein [Magnetospirillum fulvum]